MFALSAGCRRRCAANGMCSRPAQDFLTEMKPLKNDHPGYSCERAPWALVTGVGPLNCLFPQHNTRPLGFVNSYFSIVVNICHPITKDRKSTRLNSSHLGISY